MEPSVDLLLPLPHCLTRPRGRSYTAFAASVPLAMAFLQNVLRLCVPLIEKDEQVGGHRARSRRSRRPRVPRACQAVFGLLEAILTESDFYKQHGSDKVGPTRRQSPSADALTLAAQPEPANAVPLEDSEELAAWRAKVAVMDWVDVYHRGKWKPAQIGEV